MFLVILSLLEYNSEWVNDVSGMNVVAKGMMLAVTNMLLKLWYVGHFGDAFFPLILFYVDQNSVWNDLEIPESNEPVEGAK